MRWWIYNFLFFVGYAAMLPHFYLRMRRRGGYRARFHDRFGRYEEAVTAALQSAAGHGRPTWIHAVSVGEVYVAGQLMRAMRAIEPGMRFVFSTTSSTGWREAEKQVLPGDVVVYYPLDFPWCVRRALAAIRPGRLVLAESEVWPNLLRACARLGVPTYLVNARVSDRSAPGYRMLRAWFGPVLRSMRLIMAQSELDRERLLAVGARPEQTLVMGSAKFDVAPRDAAREEGARAVLRRAGVADNDVLLLGASTWPGEEELLLAIYRRLCAEHPNLRLALAPRHFERADEVAAIIGRAGFTVLRRSRINDTSGAGNSVLLIDTTGELVGYYSRADIVFVGKSMCAHGGQNMVEPCFYGVATLVGRHTENFRPAMADLLAAEGVLQVDDEKGLERELARLINDPAARRALGGRGQAVVAARRGVLARSAALIMQHEGKVGTAAAETG